MLEKHLGKIITTIVVAAGALLIRAFDLDFESLVLKYTVELILMFLLFALISFLACRALTKERREDIRKLKSDIRELEAEKENLTDKLNNAVTEANKLMDVDDEARRLRAVIMYNNNKRGE